MKFIPSFIFLALITCLSCGNDDPVGETDQEIRLRNRVEILQYLADNNIDATESSDELFVFIENEGSDEKPVIADRITINYKGYTADGSVFDESQSPVEFPLRNLIPGWQIGIPSFGRGGNGMLFIPSHLAYGASSPSFNSFIIFDIELIDF